MSDEATVLFTTAPSIKPTLAGIVATVAVAIVLVGGVFALGLDSATAETAALVVGVVALLAVLRLLFRAYVLRQTTYTVTETDIRREYAFLFRRSAREIPLHKLRGLHLSKTPFQTLFGIGTLRFLTAGPNGSLGFVAFDNVAATADHRETIRELMRAVHGE